MKPLVSKKCKYTPETQISLLLVPSKLENILHYSSSIILGGFVTFYKDVFPDPTICAKLS